MTQAWCLATNRTDLSPTEVVELYGRRFTIEETFREQKDLRFGMGLSLLRQIFLSIRREMSSIARRE